MANNITVICDLNNGDGSVVSNNGYINFTPTVLVEDTGTGLLVSTPTVSAQFTSSTAYPTASLLATDWPTYSPANWTWAVSYTNLSGPNIPAPFTFYLPSGPANFTTTQSSPAVFTWTPTTQMTTLPNGTGIQLTGGGLPGGFSGGTTYYVVNSSGTTFELASTQNGVPINASSSGSGTLTVISIHLSGLVSQGPAPVASTSLPVMATNNVVSAAGTLSVNTLTSVDATSGSFTMTLPATAASGSLLTVEKYDSTANPVTVTGSIRGVASTSTYLYSQYQSVTFTCYNNSWWPLSQNSQLDKGGHVYNVKAYGARGNTKLVLDGSMSSSSNTTRLTSATAGFTPNDVGKFCSVSGAGSAGAILSSSISAYISATQVTLANAAATTVSGATVTYGTDDTTAIQNTMNLAGPTGATVLFPPGNYLVTNHLTWDTRSDTTIQLAPSLQGSPGMGGPSIDAEPSTPPVGVTAITAASTFPAGEFIFDYLGPAPSGGAGGNTGFRVSGFILYCNSKAAGIRSFNSENSEWSFMMVNNPAAPNPAVTSGSPVGAINFVASPSFQAWNNRLERIYVVEAAQSSFYLNEGSGSYILATNCTTVNAGWAGFYAFNGVTLLGCIAQASGKNNPQGGYYYADFECIGITMVGCFAYAGPKGPGVQLSAQAFTYNVISDCTFGGTNTSGLTEKNAAVVHVIGGSNNHRTTLSNCRFITGSHTSEYVNLDSNVIGNVQFTGCMFIPAGGAPATAAYNLNSTAVTKFSNCPGINPAGTQSVGVPATTVATAALPFDATFYITGSASGGSSVAISNGPTIAIPSSASVAAVTSVFVPAGQTLTPTYSAGNAPTWVVEGQ